jgi:hypothetical protein
MVEVRKMLTTRESDPENAPGHAIEPPLGNRIKYIVRDGFSCGKHNVEGKVSMPSLRLFFERKSHHWPKSYLSVN